MYFQNSDILRTFSIIVDWDNPCSIQTYSTRFCIFRIMCSFCIFRTLRYSKRCHCRTQDILRTLSRHIVAYSGCCVTLAFWEAWQIHNFAILRIVIYLGSKAYSEPCLFRHILAYLERCVTPGYWESCQIQNFAILRTLTSLTSLFYFILTYFSTKLKIHVFGYIDINFNARLFFILEN